MSETPIRRASPAATRLAPETAIPAIDAGERASLLEGRHANPHQVLGAHAARVGGVSGAVVRVLQPAAADCAVVVHGVATPLRAEGDGFFIGFLPGVTVDPHTLMLLRYGADRRIATSDDVRHDPLTPKEQHTP